MPKKKSKTKKNHHHHCRCHEPSSTAVVFACRPCWDEFFPGKEPPGYSHDAATAIIGSECEGQFVSHGFDIVPGIVEGTDIPGLFCPHLLDEDDEP
jgi:hypothetical protein